MGRQINFYMSDKMRQEFVDFLTNKGFCYVDDGVCEEVTYIAPSDICLLYTSPSPRDRG